MVADPLSLFSAPVREWFLRAFGEATPPQQEGWPPIALRSHREAAAEAVVLAAQDPANLYGAALPWPKRAEVRRRPARVPGAYVVLLGGEALLYLEAGGRAWSPWSSRRRDGSARRSTRSRSSSGAGVFVGSRSSASTGSR